VIDTICVMSGKDGRIATEALRDLINRYPEVDGNIVHFKFKGTWGRLVSPPERFYIPAQEGRQLLDICHPAARRFILAHETVEHNSCGGAVGSINLQELPIPSQGCIHQHRRSCFLGMSRTLAAPLLLMGVNETLSTGD
jgi:hypothetical protein